VAGAEDRARWLAHRPGTVQAVLAARNLIGSTTDTKLCPAAAVLGREFSPRLVEQMWDGGSGLPAIKALQTLEFLYERTYARQPHLVFSHALTQEVAFTRWAQRASYGSFTAAPSVAIESSSFRDRRGRGGGWGGGGGGGGGGPSPGFARTSCRVAADRVRSAPSS